MGQEIATSHFSKADFDAFASRLKQETALLGTWLEDGTLSDGPPTVGFEIEVWLLASDATPAPVVESLLERLADPLVVPELATFNAEINCPPRPLRGPALSQLADDLTALWGRCQRVAETLETKLAMFGILPTVRPEHLVIANMTPRKRYMALNDQIFSLRRGRPLRLVITGRDRLEMAWEDVMLEAAATSFQLHLKIPARLAGRLYNASKILSAPLIAISANSPYLFGRDLWEETRIPLFEQAVSVGGPVLSERVNFGFRYVERSILETFEANLSRYPPLLPQLLDTRPEQLAHLRLHNGTIWRWNRPLIGFDDDGRPHVRIEHRVMPSGPTLADCIANAALYYGAAVSLINEPTPPEQQLSFAEAHRAFYEAARKGLTADLPWLDGRTHPVVEIIDRDLLPRAASGLLASGASPSDIETYLGIIRARNDARQTGAIWQRRWVARHGPDMIALTRAYLEHQRIGLPVHAWTLD